MRPYTLALALSTLLLSGCRTAAYDKPGLTYAEWKRDDAECRLAAEASAERAAPDRDAYARCMRARGYRLRAE
jgi:hypothetical protein